MEVLKAHELQIPTLGPCTVESPLCDLFIGPAEKVFVRNDEAILLNDTLEDVRQHIDAGEEQPAFEVAGPRKKIFFKPKQISCAIVTCGGLCPGLNDVIRAIVMQAHYRYGVRKIYGIRYGYEGFIPEYGHEILELSPDTVSQIHRFGGSFLGTSRGPQDITRIVDRLEELDVSILFVIGGDGSLRGADQIAHEAMRRGNAISVIGVPKTIDNDIMYLDKSFGYETAFAMAVEAIHSAHTEAIGARNGLGLVKLMGRHSGFIACSAALASGEVNYCLIPEIDFRLDGPNGFLEQLRHRIASRKHAVIVVAEGAGQNYMASEARHMDASGNARLNDIGLYLRQRIEQDFEQAGMELNLKYIDPSYIVRSVPAAPQDRVYCSRLAQVAVHAGMAGKTGMLVARWHGRYVHLPMRLSTSGRRTVDPTSDLWLSVLESTGQPPNLG